MGNLSGFDARTVEPTGFEPLPPGNYEVMIVGSEIKETSTGNGRYLKLELEIPSGRKFAGRKLFDNLNIWHSSDKAAQIAKSTLSAICRAVNKLTLNDSSELHGSSLLVMLVVENREGHGPQNRIKGYHALPGAKSSTSSKTDAAVSAAVISSSDTPW